MTKLIKLKKYAWLCAGLIALTAFTFQMSRQLAGEERLGLLAANSASDYSLDGTLEPDEIPGFARISDVFRDNMNQNKMIQNGAAQNNVVQQKLLQNGNINVYAPDNITLPVDAPINMPESIVTNADTILIQNQELAQSGRGDISLTPPPRFRTESDLVQFNEKYALVQYRSKTKTGKDESQDEVKQTAPEVPTRDFSAMNETERADALKKAIRATLTANTKRAVTTQNNTPGDVLLMALAYGADAKVYQPAANVDSRDKNAPRGSYIYSIGTLCWNYPCSGKTLLRSDGKRVYARVGAGFQPRPAAFLALLAMSNIMPNYELKVNGGIYSIGHLIASEKSSVSRGMNMSLALVGLSFYGESSDQWKNEMGETWTIERMVTEELNRSIDQGSSDVTDWLLGLTAAVKLYEEEGRAIRGAMALAKKQLTTFHEFVLSVQNDQYLWHPKFFLFKGSSPDVYETLYSSGHILRWLLLSLSDKELKEPRVVKAVTSLMSNVNKIPANVAAGTLTNRQLEAMAISLHALSIYNIRVYGEETPDETEKKSTAGSPFVPAPVQPPKVIAVR